MEGRVQHQCQWEQQWKMAFLYLCIALKGIRASTPASPPYDVCERNRIAHVAFKPSKTMYRVN